MFTLVDILATIWNEIHVTNLFQLSKTISCVHIMNMCVYVQWERATFDAVFNLIGAVRTEPTTLKDVAMYYEAETSDMLWEVTSLLRGWLAVTLLYGFEERLFGLAEMRYSEEQCQISEEMFPYMFGTPFDKSNKMIEYLNYGQSEIGLIPNLQLPKCSTKPSLMRQGNLRADGAIQMQETFCGNSKSITATISH